MKSFNLDQLKAETDRLKSETNLVDFARHYDQFAIDPKKNSNNQIEHMNCVFLRNDVDDKIVVTRNDNGHYIYFNPENDRDKGTIFDFIENRRSGKDFSMSYAKKVIYDFDGNLNKNYIKASGIKLLPRSNKDDYNKVQAYFKKLPALNNTDFLESRGISKELLYSPVCKNRIYNENYNDDLNKRSYINTVFPLYGYNEKSESVVLGFERRNSEFKGAFQGSLKSASIWVSAFEKGKPVTDFVVSESPLDSLSYAEIKKDWRSANNVYAATSGSAWDGHIDLYQKTINNLKPDNLILANDNDCAGERFNCKILGRLDLSKYVDEEYLGNNKMLVNADIEINLADKYTGQIEWKLSHDKVPELVNDKVSFLEQHIPSFNAIRDLYENKNIDLLEVNRDKKIFHIESSFKDNYSKVSIKFPNNHENWKVVSDTIVQLKLDFAEGVKIERPISKDWNQDLMNDLGLIREKKIVEQVEGTIKKEKGIKI